MQTLKHQKLNIHEDFMRKFNALSLVDVLVWINKVMLIYYCDAYNDLNQQVIYLIDKAIDHDIDVVSARLLAFEIHMLARKKQNHDQFYLRALGHMVSTIHVKTHALKCCDYLIKMLSVQTKNKDEIIAERLRQISLIYEINQ